MKRFIMICIALLCFPISSFAAERERYVALGDSIAAGQTPYREIDTGYVDLIAQQLSTVGRLVSYDRSLAFPGLTVEQVLQSTQTDEAKAILQEATLITISAGANNLLPLISHNPNTGTLAFSKLSANFALNKVRIGIDELLTELEQLAPNAKVYVMGYYFPYSHVHEDQLAGVTKELATMNMILQQQAEKYQATFIEVESAFAVDRLAYLPNSADVHPNRLGYLAMANAFLTQYGLQTLSEAQMPPANPQSFEQLLQQQVNREKQIASVQPRTIEQYIVRYGYERMLI